MRWVFGELLWFGLAAAIIFVDARQVEAAADPEHPDLTNRGVVQYLPFMLLFGGFLIPFYLWNSRKTAGAVLAGLGLMFGCAFVVGLVLGA